MYQLVNYMSVYIKEERWGRSETWIENLASYNYNI